MWFDVFHIIGKKRFKLYAQMRNYPGITGADAAERILLAHGVSGMTIDKCAARTARYSPEQKVLWLPHNIFDGVSLMAVCIAAHEAGHAIQDFDGQSLKLLDAFDFSPTLDHLGSLAISVLLFVGLVFISPIRYFLNILMDPLVAGGFADTTYPASKMMFDTGLRMIFAGIALYLLILALNSISLRLEFDASRRALETIRDISLLEEGEMDDAKEALRAAAMVSVAGMINHRGEYAAPV